jgi:2-polyprenyl-3-methyl-5-hydroxy-6-metoxy-1,4-benzoquinol methylase
MSSQPSREQARVRLDAQFASAREVLDRAQVAEALERAQASWRAASQTEAERQLQIINTEFPDEYHPDAYWNAAADHGFRDFFSWGHDHDFGHGVRRTGAMSGRHLEIIGECLTHGFFPPDLSGRTVLDVGCWSGGDILALTGLGGSVTAIEEHRRSAASAHRLCDLVGCNAEIVVDSVYNDRRDWQGRFDLVYAAGVIYHVTDPLLFARILFAYLKPGGSLILETKATSASDSACHYSGTLERGWNWYAPSREALGRWLADAGFDVDGIQLLVRGNGRLLSCSTKRAPGAMRETAGFSRPGSWLEGPV